MSIHASHRFVLDEARANIAFIKANPSHVPQAQQINTALAVIVTSERNMVMHRALEHRRHGNTLPHEEVQGLPES